MNDNISLKSVTYIDSSNKSRIISTDELVLLIERHIDEDKSRLMSDGLSKDCRKLIKNKLHHYELMLDYLGPQLIHTQKEYETDVFLFKDPEEKGIIEDSRFDAVVTLITSSDCKNWQYLFFKKKSKDFTLYLRP